MAIVFPIPNLCIFLITFIHTHIYSCHKCVYLCISDGKYYVTVRGINDIEFGPLALSVCHAQPFAIDTTPPIIYEVYDLAYDEDSFLISFRVNATYVNHV